MLREYPSRRYKNICWIVLLAVLAACFFTVHYTDIMITYKHSLEFLNCAWEGKLSEFYLYTNTYVEGLGNVGVAMYPMTVYLIFAIWNLPIWLLMKAGLLWYPDSRPCWLWCKGLLIVALVGACWLMCSILKEVGKKREEQEEALFLLLTALLFVEPIFAAAQYDIICLFFILLGIRQRLRDGRLTLKVVLIFAWASTLKFFALLVFAIVVLLDEKRLWRIFLALLVGFAGMKLFDFSFLHIEKTADMNIGLKYTLTYVFKGSITAGLGDLPLFPARHLGSAWQPTVCARKAASNT